MELITRETMARDAVARWSRYPKRHGRRGDLATTLADMGDDPDPDAVEDALRKAGKPGMGKPGACDECKQDAPALVEMGPDPDYEIQPVKICGQCLLKALQLIDGDWP